MTKTRKIYCDESGYTGNDLLEKNQPYFVYSGVCLDDKTTTEIISYIHNNYNIQNNEIKGKQLVNSEKGRRVIENIFENYANCARVVYADKKYTLACKIIEYAIEPFLESNGWFYGSRLNEYLAIELYFAFITSETSAENIFKELLLILRGKKTLEETTFQHLSINNSIIKWIVDIIGSNPQIVLDEIQDTNGDTLSWILNLTETSLLGILSEWSKNGERLKVTCDNSKIFNDSPLIESLNQRGLNSIFIEYPAGNLGFSLEEEIQTGDSKHFSELQIADIFSSALFYCLKNKESKFSKKILAIVYKECICIPYSFIIVPPLLWYKELSTKQREDYHIMMLGIHNQIMSS